MNRAQLLSESADCRPNRGRHALHRTPQCLFRGTPPLSHLRPDQHPKREPLSGPDHTPLGTLRDDSRHREIALW